MILVDALRRHDTSLRCKMWCHMVSTVDETELHEFARRLGLRRSWAQLRPAASAAHYDLTPERRAMAVRLGAAEVGSRELVAQNFDGLRRRGLLVDPIPGSRSEDNSDNLACVVPAQLGVVSLGVDDRDRGDGDDWRARMRLALGECATPAEWVARYPGRHCWFKFRDDDYDSCANCGAVRRHDDENRPCRGIVRIELRGDVG